MRKISVFKPQYHKHFQCIGSDCSYNCCCNWNIFIDKETYDKYMNVSDTAMKKMFKENIVVDENNPKNISCLLDENGNCKFLDGKGLCSIQLKYGYNYLCKTCRQYPRMGNLVDGAAELFLNLSCEEAVRLCLFNENRMVFEESLMDMSELYYLSKSLTPSDYIHEEDDEEIGYTIFWCLRNLSIFIIQNRNYTVSQRLILLGIFIKQADDCMKDKKYEQLREVAKNFRSRIERGSYNDEFFEKIPKNPSLKNKLLLRILFGLTSDPKNPLYECVQEIKQVFSLNSESTDFPYKKTESIRTKYFILIPD